MKANGEDIKRIQELLRHSNYKVTADKYTQAVTPASGVDRSVHPKSRFDRPMFLGLDHRL